MITITVPNPLDGRRRATMGVKTVFELSSEIHRRPLSVLLEDVDYELLPAADVEHDRAIADAALALVAHWDSREFTPITREDELKDALREAVR